MNEEIKKLADRALEIVSNDRTLADGQIEKTWFPDHFNEVFAELIIRDCAEKINEAYGKQEISLYLKFCYGVK